jgi:carbonic anhydrase
MRNRGSGNWARNLTYNLGMLLAALCLVAAGAGSGWCADAVVCNEVRPPSPADAVKSLVDGNQRWSTGATRHSGRDFARRECVAKEGQTPFAAIVSCSDSRVPPELLFDEGVGDLFVVRVAGNSVDKLGEQSLQYSAEHLGVETIMVVGHQKCGAVKAAVETYPKSAPKFLSLIYNAVAKAKELIKRHGGDPDDLTALNTESIDQHVILEVEQLRSTSPFKEMIDHGKLKIVGGRYDLENGHVTMLIQ